ncbi:MAG TPA: FecR domain-containing protein [Chitinophaga sp.]|uniref:FecR family protein n=1 Tax=Chitinophaga sp. TaxID=1869181 RepID=UPI002CB7BAE4|nr:FecR domain-containing protein [Chitinophaga sp.]HVI48687.1 FecR domain-containing protein [Chitinophaga sp.]
MDLQQYKAEDFILNDSFVRYCLRSNESDVQFWESWLERYPHKQEEAAKAREWVFRLGLRLTPEEKDAEFEKLKAAIAVADEDIQPVSTQIGWKRILRIAAAVITPVALLSAWWITNRSHSVPQENKKSYTVYAAGDSIRRRIILQDGSEVILNAHSTLAVPVAYNEEDRRLQLKGEALFDVAKADGKPFIVSTGNIDVQALGTAFKVRAYGFDITTSVMLVNGKVRVAQDSATTELTPGEKLSTHKDHPAFAKSTFNIEKETAWRKGQLVFSNASLADIAQQLEYWYGIRVEVQQGKYKPIRFNGVFNNKPLNEVLAAVCFVNGLESMTRQDVLLIRPARTLVR